MNKLSANLIGITRGSSVFAFSLWALAAVIIFCPLAFADGVDQFTTLMIHSDTYEGDGNFVDASPGAHLITVLGDTHHSTLQAQFGSSSISFDGSGDYLEIPNSDDWNFGGGDFTIDMWIRPSDSSELEIMQFGRDPVGEHSGDESVSWALNANYTVGYPPGFHFYGRKADFTQYEYFSNTPNLPVDIWTHVAVVRSGNELMFFSNGHKVFSASMDFAIRSNSTKPLKIGAVAWNDIVYGIKGFIDEIRISKGVARWTADFVPPTQPYDTQPPPGFPTADAGPDRIVQNTVTLDGSLSSDPDGSIESYEWNLEHRENPAYDRSASGMTATVSALEPGFYDVILTVTDNAGLVGIDTMLLAVSGPTPTPNTNLDLTSLRVTTNKRSGQTSTEILGTIIDFPQLNVTNGSTVQSRITIVLFGVLEVGADLVVSEEATLTVKETKKTLDISK
jgi:hypothetical protein